MAIGCASACEGAEAQQCSSGITQRTTFPAFNPNAPPCTPPQDRAKVLAYVEENVREFLQGVHFGLQLAAKDRGLA